MTLLEIQIGTTRTSVPGRVAVVDLPPEEAWVSTGEPHAVDRRHYAVVGQTADGWPVPLDGQ